RGGPVYLSFDIDSLDPAYAPGTGTVEVGGLTSQQALEIVRGLRGLDLVGCDLVEVSPPYDPFGQTAILAANLLFEMLCVLPGVRYPCAGRDDRSPYVTSSDSASPGQAPIRRSARNDHAGAACLRSHQGIRNLP